MISIFLGAGFSKWAFDLPLVSQLFDFNISYLTASEEKKLYLIKEDWSVWIQKIRKQHTKILFIGVLINLLTVGAELFGMLIEG
ncbi:hypothetical protein [Klebsiella quasipneumoniae]|uniref:hypothetical protein n=1 Tax=Klebsiella quasipneumoniae TaxID=1463165 RepID=UPI001C65D620|nr:hypothetical protein [Klebsiella quasipneumoniae]MCS6405628.1 hypothetical protein [Klebsiella quasipneumoniae subsp. quasipneumoniae]